MQKGTCKLCLQERELCKESHIIPSFLYKFLYGPNHLLVYLHQNGPQFKYNGEYESNILCKECDEGILGKLDDYAAKFIHNGFRTKINPRLEIIDSRQCCVIEKDPNYDYSRFKLFLLSLLWRGSISSRPFFQNLKLDLEVEEKLRLMIKHSQPGEPDEYACFMYLPPLTPTPDGGMDFKTFYMPTTSLQQAKRDGWEFCEFTIIGMKYYFLISRPTGTKVLPGVEKDKLTIGFSSIEEQEKLIEQIIQIMQNHPRRK